MTCSVSIHGVFVRITPAAVRLLIELHIVAIAGGPCHITMPYLNRAFGFADFIIVK